MQHQQRVDSADSALGGPAIALADAVGSGACRLRLAAHLAYASGGASCCSAAVLLLGPPNLAVATMTLRCLAELYNMSESSWLYGVVMVMVLDFNSSTAAYARCTARLSVLIAVGRSASTVCCSVLSVCRAACGGPQVRPHHRHRRHSSSHLLASTSNTEVGPWQSAQHLPNIRRKAASSSCQVPQTGQLCRQPATYVPL